MVNTASGEFETSVLIEILSVHRLQPLQGYIQNYEEGIPLSAGTELQYLYDVPAKCCHHGENILKIEVRRYKRCGK